MYVCTIDTIGTIIHSYIQSYNRHNGKAIIRLIVFIVGLKEVVLFY